MRFLLIFAGASLYGQGLIFPPTFKSVNGGAPGMGAISLTKTASPSSGISTLGTVITYTYTITNSGGTNLNLPFTINDNKQGIISTCGLPSGILAPNASTSCTSPHATVQADLDAGSLINTATASNGSVSATTPMMVTFTQSPAMTISKTSNPTTFSSTPTTLTYTYTVKNTGNVTLSKPVSISDDHAGTLTNCGTQAIAPQGTQQCQLTYNTTPTDLSNGSVTNNVTAASSFTLANGTSQPLSASASLKVLSGIDITTVCSPGPTCTISGHALTNAKCDNSTDDSLAIQATLNYAYSLATATNPPVPVTVTGPNNVTCKTQNWHSLADTGGQQSSVIDLPSYVNLIGSGTLGTSTPLTFNCNGGSPPTFNPSCVSIGLYAITWQRGSHTFYAVNSTLAGNNTIQLSGAGPFPSFTAGDYVMLYVQNPTCNGCDVVPSEFHQIKTYNAATGLITIQAAANTGAPGTLAFTFNNGAFTYTPTGGSPTMNVVSLFDVTQSCGTNPVVSASCHLQVGGSLQNMKVLSLGQVNITEVVGFTMNYVTYDQSQNWTDELNSLHWVTISNSTFTCSGCSGNFNQPEYMQRVSGSNLISNNVYGTPTVPMNAWSNAEAPHANIITGNTLYLVAGSGNPNTFDSAGTNELLTLNNVHLVGTMSTGAGTIGALGDGQDEPFSGGAAADPCGTKCYIKNVQITFNTIFNCTGVAGTACILVAENGTTVDHNTINIPSSSVDGIALRDPGTGSGHGFNTVTTNNTVHLSAGGRGYYNPGNTGPDNWVVNNNTIDNTGPGNDVAISIGTSVNVGTGGGCSITGNTIGTSGNISSPMVGGSQPARNAIVSAHPTCVIQSSP